MMRIGNKSEETAIIVLGAFKDAIRKTGQINVRKENEEETIEYIDMAIEALKSQSTYRIQGSQEQERSEVG